MKPKMTMTKFAPIAAGAKPTVRMRIEGDVGAELRGILDAAGWTEEMGHVGKTVMLSPFCGTPAEIDAARPASLRSLVTV